LFIESFEVPPTQLILDFDWEHNNYQAKSWKSPRRIIVKAERLFEIAARVTVSFRRILFSLPSSCPVQGLWLVIFERLRAGLPLPSS
jgi:hypothetical protein